MSCREHIGSVQIGRKACEAGRSGDYTEKQGRVTARRCIQLPLFRMTTASGKLSAHLVGRLIVGLTAKGPCSNRNRNRTGRRKQGTCNYRNIDGTWEYANTRNSLKPTTYKIYSKGKYTS